MMSGKNNHTFAELYGEQIKFQNKVEAKSGRETTNLPFDNPKQFQYHITAIQEELGEVLKADKRWKTHRNNTYIVDEKLDELADVFITVMNICIWSGFNDRDILDSVANKITKNNERIDSV